MTTATDMSADLRAKLKRGQVAALIIGVVACFAAAAGVFSNTKQFFFSYLFAWLFWIGLSLGCMVVTMIHHLTGGRWGYPSRRFLEAGFCTLPVMIVLFIPICFGLRYLFPWKDPAEVASDTVLHGRHGYLNTAGFIIRAVIFFAVVIWMCTGLRRNSLAQDLTGDAEPTRRARAISGPGVVIYVLLATVVYVDWVLSLEKHWYSTMFPIIIVIGQILGAYAFAILMVSAFRNEPPLISVLNKTHYHHLGTLLFTFVLFWTYISFGQLLIIYSGDLPDEIGWYRHRIATSWKVILAAIALFHFFLPFFLLLFRTVKKHVAGLTSLAALVFVMRIVDVYWLVMPALNEKGARPSWMDFATVIGIGGLWFAFFVTRLSRAPLIPRHDPGIQFAFVYAPAE